MRFTTYRQALANGLQLVVAPRRHLPIVSLGALIRVGTAAERGHEAGLASFTAGLLPRGTERRDAVHLAEEIDGLGAQLGVHSDYDFTIAGVTGLARHFEQFLDLLTDVLTRPAFHPTEVEKRRHDTLSLLERRKDDPLEQVRNRFIARLYGAHPYGHPREGTPDTIRGFTSETVRAFHMQQFRPDQTTLAVVGDVAEGEVVSAAARLLENWSSPGAAPEEAAPPLSAQTARTVDRIQKDGLTQATLRIGGPGIERRHPDYVPLLLLNYILGGSGFGSRLMTRLREEGGLTYGAYSNFHSRIQSGYFFASCQTGLATMNQALSWMFEEVVRIRDEGVTQEERDWAVRFFTGSLPLTLETNDHLANRILEQCLYELPDEFWLLDLDRMRACTVEEIHQAALRHLHPESFAVVCLADFRHAELRVPGLGNGP